jgi:uncharacterized membrane protein
MKDMTLIACYWAHLIATVIWFGGIIFILYFVMPSSRQVLGAESDKLMREISKRFAPAANLSIIVLVATGAVLTGLNRQYSGVVFLENGWSSALMVKSIPVVGMIAVHFYRGMVLGPKIMRTTAETEKKSLKKLSLNLVRVNFALGLLVLLVGTVLRIA